MTTSSTETKTIERLAKALKAAVKGEVRFDPFSRVLYSTDASIYQIMPVGVVIPRDAEDIAATLRLAADSGTPVLPRGAGTSLAGQSVGRAIILDCSKYMNRIVEIDPSTRRARVQPGVVQDELNLAARAHGLRLGPDTATSNRATLGGMMGNNSCGARSIVYGKMIDHVEELSILLIDGTALTLRGLTPDAAREALRGPGRTGDLYREVARIVEDHRGPIERRFPKLQRRVSGYNLDALLADPTDLRKVLIGSEGTLGVITEAVVGLVPRPAHTAVGVVHFHDLLEALEATRDILTLGPSAVELIDRMVLEMTRNQLEYARQLGFVQGDPDALLIVEFAADDAAGPAECLAELERLVGRGAGYALTKAVGAAEQDNIWRVRKAGQGLLQGIKGDSKPITFVEDTAVPPALLAPYIRRFRDVLSAEGVRAAFYAHASVGVIHVRPLINLKDRGDIGKMKRIASAIGELVIEFGGTMSGEHGDGLVRSWFIERFFGPDVYAAFVRLKRAFDPPGLMNPGKIVDAPPIDASLRYGPDYRTQPVTTHFDWTADGGFAGSVELCSGLGACRKTVDGTMCPSYMVTREEEHSTRGRANLLRAALSGTLPASDLTGRRLYEALDLCLECKGCKGECPANVDMAKLKYEFLSRYHDAHGLPLRARLFAHVRALNRLGSPLAPAAPWLAGSAPVRWAMERVLGIHRARPLPPLARRTFLRWWEDRKRGSGEARTRRPVASRGTVALFADTFTIYNYPELGQAAVTLLEGLGFEVTLAPAGCCGRPMISKGLLGPAAALSRRNVELLRPLAEQGVPIVGLEPSCILTFRDEVPDLVSGEPAKIVARGAKLIDEFLSDEHRRSPLPIAGIGRGRRVLFHGHCHQKALIGSAASRRLLAEAGFVAEEVDSGCCGMAGAFGFEAEHYQISMAIGERRLLPAVRAQAADTAVVAMGVSCRQQIAHGTGRRAVHLVEVLADALSHGGGGSRDRGNA